MTIEVCDLCNERVYGLNKTEIIIKDNKGLSFDDYGCAWPSKRKYKAIICDDCLHMLKKNKEHKNERS